MNAATGDVFWTYRPRYAKDIRPTAKRAMAIYEDKLFVQAANNHMVALNARTGDVISGP